MSSRMEKTATVYAVIAGTCDTATGLLLMTAPVATLGLMKVSAVPAEPVYLQWIGAFVFSVGSCYLLPFLSRDPWARRRRLAVMLEMTAFVRVVIALFSGVAIARGSIAMDWISVPVTDAVFAAIQLFFIGKGVFRADA